MTFHQTFAKTHSLILPYFFTCKTYFPKSMGNIPGKEGAETCEEPSGTFIPKMDLFAKIVKGYLLSTILAKKLHLRCSSGL